MHVDEQRIQVCTPGIAQGASATNLGFGNLYYALVRVLRPRHVLVIGSGFGFSPAVMGLALADNGFGALTFVDPSMDRFREGLNVAHGGTGQWDTPEQVVARFSCAGVPPGIVTHYKETNQDFFAKYAYRGLSAIDLALIDGAHDEANAAFDLAAVVDQISLPGYVLMHDATHFLNRTPWMGVTQVVERARAKGGVEEVTFPGDAGLALQPPTNRDPKGTTAKRVLACARRFCSWGRSGCWWNNASPAREAPPQSNYHSNSAWRGGKSHAVTMRNL